MGFLLLIIIVFVCLLNLPIPSVLSFDLPFGFRSEPFNLNPSIPSKSDYPVCIIGAGISGLHLGNLLQAKGYRVEIFEANDHVGGKAETYQEDTSVLIEKGPLIFSRNNPGLLAYINKFNLTPVLSNLSDMLLFDSDNGSIQPRPSLSPDRIRDAAQRYIEHHISFTKDLEPGYLKASPELYVPFSTWLSARNLSVLSSLLIFSVTVGGYGHLDDTPALYALKLTNPTDFAVLGRYSHLDSRFAS